MKQRLEQIKFLDVTTSMLPYGIPFPVIPESTEIMNNIVPSMVQNALVKTYGEAVAVDHVSMTIRDGEFVAWWDRPAAARPPPSTWWPA